MMEEKNFAALLSILGIIESEDLAGFSIEACINHLTDRFEGELDEEQKSRLAIEFAQYYRRKGGSLTDIPIRDGGGDY